MSDHPCDGDGVDFDSEGYEWCDTHQAYCGRDVD